MSTLIFANRAQSTLASALTSVATTVSLAPGTGNIYPLPTGNQYFVMTLVDAATGNVTEVVWVTNRAGDTLTILRGQEGTTAKSWLVNDLAACFPTAGTQSVFVQPDQLQQGLYNYTVATGTANALAGSISSDLTSLPDGLSVTVKALTGNTGVATFQLTLGATVQPALNIVKGNNSPLVAGDIPTAGYQMQLNWSASFNAYIMQNPATGVSVIPVGSVFQFPSTAAPTGFLLCNGQLVSRTTYAALYTFANASGNIVADGSWQSGNFSYGDGSTTFRLPQYGGYFLRALDNGNGIDPGRAIGTIQGGQIVSHSHLAASTTNVNAASTSSGTATSTVTDPGHFHSEGATLGPLVPPGAYVAIGNAGPSISAGGGGANIGLGGTPFPTNTATTGISVATSISVATTTSATGITTTSIQNTGGNETRPVNVSILMCIKY